jgi:hypothetical protein
MLALPSVLALCQRRRGDQYVAGDFAKQYSNEIASDRGHRKFSGTSYSSASIPVIFPHLGGRNLGIGVQPAARPLVEIGLDFVRTARPVDMIDADRRNLNLPWPAGATA